ncbi:hypothetical protein ACR80S_04740 [Halomonas sp. MA07-2]|uniref:hypothetical protein n=1 Tax=Halomonas sp. MA07-2 TaxID=3440841 RepID=UPI003EEAF5E4
MDDVSSQFIAANQTAIQLAVALLLGALIGIERGWVAREQKSGERIDAATAVLGIVIAAAVNNLVKAGLAAGFGTPRTAWRLGMPMLASLAAGLALAWLA